MYMYKYRRHDVLLVVDILTNWLENVLCPAVISLRCHASRNHNELFNEKV